MPELPEVETIARGLHKRVAGDRIESVWIGSKPEPLKSSAAEIASALEGAQIESVQRVGKHIVFDLKNEDPGNHVSATKSRRAAQVKSGPSAGKKCQWIVHLGMTGRMLVAQPEMEIAAHTHLVAKLGSGRELRFVDPRRFGRLEVCHEEFAGPGREPLRITLDEFGALFHGRKAPVKGALLNQNCCMAWAISMPTRAFSGRGSVPVVAPRR